VTNDVQMNGGVRVRRIFLVAMTLGSSLAVASCANFQSTDQYRSAPSRPPAVPADPTCATWKRLDGRTQTEYADWRLWSLRTADGIPPHKPTTTEQVRSFRDAIASGCRSPVYSLESVSHGVYTQAYRSRRYLDP
jgi:hypothetical protein